MPRSLSPVVLPGDPTVALQAGTKQYIDAGLALKVNSSLVGAVSGVAQLDSGGHVPTSQIPDLSATYATLSTGQTISGTKTFSASPVVPATSSAGHAINRGETDDRGLMDFRASRWGLTACTFHPMYNTGSGVYSISYMALSRCFIPAGVPINNICAIVGTVGAGAAGTGMNGFSVYEISGSTGTLVSNSTNDVTMWTATGWAKKSLNTSVASQGSDREVLLGHAVSIATTGPAVMLVNMRTSTPFNTRVTDGVSVGMTYYVASPTSWPSTFTMTSNYDFFYPFLGVY